MVYRLSSLLFVSCLFVKLSAWTAVRIRGRVHQSPLYNRLVDGKIVVDEDPDELQPKTAKRCFDFPPYYYKDQKYFKDDEKKQKIRVRISSSKENQKVDERERKPYKRLPKYTSRILESVEKSAVKTRLLEERSYGLKEPYLRENLGKPPTLEDIASSTSNYNLMDSFWISVPARLLTFFAGYYSFPYLSQFLNFFVTMQPDQLVSIVCFVSRGNSPASTCLILFPGNCDRTTLSTSSSL